MALEVLLDPEITRMVRNQTDLPAFYDELDGIDRQTAEAVAAIPIPEDPQIARLQAAGMDAKAERRREAQQIVPAKTPRPLVRPLSGVAQAAYEHYYPRHIGLGSWTGDGDVPDELIDLLTGLKEAKVFSDFEVWEPKKGTSARRGVLIMGVGGAFRYREEGAPGRVPVARFNNHSWLTPLTTLTVRQCVVPALWIPSISLGVALGIAGIITRANVPDHTAAACAAALMMLLGGAMMSAGGLGSGRAGNNKIRRTPLVSRNFHEVMDVLFILPLVVGLFPFVFGVFDVIHLL